MVVLRLASDHVHPTPRYGRCRIRTFVPYGAEPGERLGDRSVVVCSEVEGNPGARVAEAAKEIHADVTATFGLGDPLWIEHV